jgi:hypothetical protein
MHTDAKLKGARRVPLHRRLRRGFEEPCDTKNGYCNRSLYTTFALISSERTRAEVVAWTMTKKEVDGVEESMQDSADEKNAEDPISPH